MTTYSPVKQEEKNHSILNNSTLNHHAYRIAATSVNLLNLHTTTKIPPVGKEYMSFHNYGKTAQAAKFIKSRIITKLIDYVFLIDTFEQQCVVLKGMLQSSRPEYHAKTIGTDQSLSKNAIFEHKYLQKINKIIQTF